MSTSENASDNTPKLADILAVAKPSTLLAPRLNAAFNVHAHDPATLAAIGPTIRGIFCGGESKVSAELIAQLPALEIISVMGVGYDGIDVVAAKAAGVVVTHTPDVLNDDVADPGNLVMPVLTYEHGDDGCSVSGAAVYRGSTLASLTGDFIYGDYCSGKVWALDLASARNDLLLDDFEGLTAVRTGPDGEVYILEAGGAISRLTPG